MELLVLFDWFIGSKNCEIFLFVYLLMLRTPLEVVRLRGYFFFNFHGYVVELVLGRYGYVVELVLGGYVSQLHCFLLHPVLLYF